MKKLPILVIFLLFTFTSCNNFYFSSFDDSKLISKTSIKTFEHLKEPIVISLPVYDTLYLFGNEKMGSKNKRLGDIIAVIDIETDAVFDWIYYPGEHGWSNWRLTETSQNPTLYLFHSAGLGELAMLDPTKTSLSISKTNLHDSLWAQRCYGKYAPICTTEWSLKKFNVNLFNVETQSIEKTLSVFTDSVGYIGRLRSDSTGNLYFTSALNRVYSLHKIDVNNLTIKTAKQTFDMVSREGDDTEDQFDDFGVEFISDDYIFLKREPLGNYNHPRKMYLIDKNTLETKKIINIKNANEEYFYDIQFINGKYYIISPPGKFIYLYELDIENETWRKLNVELIFDMTENVYVRGTKIYFMNSRNPSDIFYTYYDVVSGEQGKVIEISVESILN